jgi:hypothetical protein
MGQRAERVKCKCGGTVRSEAHTPGLAYSIIAEKTSGGIVCIESKPTMAKKICPFCSTCTEY